jgi:hypothetical protein
MRTITRHRITIIAGAITAGLFVALHILAWIPRESFALNISMTVACYLAAACAVATVVAGILARKETTATSTLAAMRMMAIAAAVFTIAYLVLGHQVRLTYAPINDIRNCVREQVQIAAALLATDAPFPPALPASHHAICSVTPLYLPWLAAAPRPVGINIHLAGKRYEDIPTPERTVLLADCLSPGGRITTPGDIDWNSHGAQRGTIILCTGMRWKPAELPRDELIVNPW